MSATNALCEGCGITAADMPYEEMGLDLEEASDQWFTHVEGFHGMLFCRGCAAQAGGTP